MNRHGINPQHVHEPLPNEYVDGAGLFTDFVSGVGPKVRNFKDGDSFAEKLRNSRHIQNLIEKLQSQIYDACDECNSEPIIVSGADTNYSMGGVAGVGVFVVDHLDFWSSAGFEGNSAVAFVGSYKAELAATQIDCKKGRATISIQIDNSTNGASFLRPPILGYTDARKPHAENINNVIGDSGLLSPIAQSASLTEEFDWPGNPACKGVGCE